MRQDILDKKTQILEWISSNQSKAFICKQIKCKPETLDSYLVKMEIEYCGNKSGKGIKSDPKKKTALEYLNSSYVKSHLLRTKLLEDGIKEHICEQCKNSVWNGILIPLELHHKDGDHYNNQLENLQLLCPNCHAQCDNNSGKGRGSVAERQTH